MNEDFAKMAVSLFGDDAEPFLAGLPAHCEQIELTGFWLARDRRLPRLYCERVRLRLIPETTVVLAGNESYLREATSERRAPLCRPAALRQPASPRSPRDRTSRPRSPASDPRRDRKTAAKNLRARIVDRFMREYAATAPGWLQPVRPFVGSNLMVT